MRNLFYSLKKMPRLCDWPRIDSIISCIFVKVACRFLLYCAYPAIEYLHLRFPCVIITAKGQPDVATRMFLKKVKATLEIPVLGLVDSDPYGLKILSVYMQGSKNMAYDSASLTTPDIKWLGVRPSDLKK